MTDDYREPPVTPMVDKIPVPLEGHSGRAISIRTAEDGRVGLYLARDMWMRVLSVLVTQPWDEDVQRMAEGLAADFGFVERDPTGPE